MLAVLLPLVMLAGIATPVGIVYGLDRLRDQTRPSGAPTVPANDPDAGGPGVGDPYFPDYGSSGYDAVSYAVTLDWDAAAEFLRASTTITATATRPLKSFYVDLALTTDAVQVDGAPAVFEQSGFADVKITPSAPIAPGASFTVVVDYSGEPGTVRRGDIAPWSTKGQEWIVAGEPESAAWWFASNDHPSDPALMDVSVRVPAGMEAVSNGRLSSSDTADEVDFDTWHWVSSEPMATYLAFLAIGQFQLDQGTADGRPYVYAVSEQLSPADRDKALSALRTTPASIRALEAMYGTYPFSEAGGIVPVHDLFFAGLEAQTRPVYASNAITDGDFSAELITHELAHMWFGDNVTLRQWNDVFTNEAYASWSGWGVVERAGGSKANDQLNRVYGRTSGDVAFWRVTMIDPGAANLFSTVYLRGPMTLQALRNVIGDDAYFELARDWAQDPGTRSLEEWMITAQSKTTVDLVPFFQAWIFSPTAPEHTEANGFR